MQRQLLLLANSQTFKDLVRQGKLFLFMLDTATMNTTNHVALAPRPQFVAGWQSRSYICMLILGERVTV